MCVEDEIARFMCHTTVAPSSETDSVSRDLNLHIHNNNSIVIGGAPAAANTAELTLSRAETSWPQGQHASVQSKSGGKTRLHT
jgi:hypothetical protein